MTKRIYVACLAAYNNGILHGRWIDATSNVHDLQDQVNAMLASSPEPNAEEYAIHDTEYLDIGEYAGLQTVADLMALYETFESEFGPDGEEILEAFIHCFGEGDHVTIEHARDAYCGHYDSKREYAEQLVDDCGYLQGVPDTVATYFDYEAFARDLFITDMVMHDGHVFNRNW